jgi:hypothetical protein
VHKNDDKHAARNDFGRSEEENAADERGNGEI